MKAMKMYGKKGELTGRKPEREREMERKMCEVVVAYVDLLLLIKTSPQE